MSSKIEVELTSDRQDGTWTWRAAGAKAPKGTLSTTLLYQGAKIGDIVKAEVVFAMDGIEVEAVYPPKSKAQPENIITVISKEPRELITSNVSKRKSNDRRGDDARRTGSGGPRDDRRDRRPRSEGKDFTGTSEGRSGSAGVERPRSERPRGDRRPSQDRGPRPERVSATSTQQGSSDQRGSLHARPQSEKPSRQLIDRTAKLQVGNRHRMELINSLPEEHRLIAEQLSKGGLSAVRGAIAAANDKARSEGTQETPETPVLKIAEQLDPQMKLAYWFDRADAINKAASKASLRDIRAVVAAAEPLSKDDRVREQAEALKALWKEMSDKTVTDWLKSIADSLDESRLIRALRLASRPPEPTAKFPSELASRLVESTNAAMTADTPPERWLSVMDALSESPIRRQVKPVALPDGATPEQLDIVKQASSRIPALTEMLGISMPPPPRPRPARPGSPKTGSPRARSSIRPNIAPVAEAPVAEAPVAEAPVAEAPVAEAPVAEAP